MRRIYGNFRGKAFSYVRSQFLSTFQSLATRHSCVPFQLPSIQLHGTFQCKLKKKSHLENILSFSLSTQKKKPRQVKFHYLKT